MGSVLSGLGIPELGPLYGATTTQRRAQAETRVVHRDLLNDSHDLQNCLDPMCRHIFMMIKTEHYKRPLWINQIGFLGALLIHDNLKQRHVRSWASNPFTNVLLRQLQMYSNELGNLSPQIMVPPCGSTVSDMDIGKV